MILKLDIHLYISIFSSSQSNESSQNFTLKTSFTKKQLCWQASSIKALLYTEFWSPSSSLNCALNQLVKGCQLAMHSTILLAKKNKKLYKKNEKKKQKCTQSKRQIPSEEGLSVLEAFVLIMQSVKATETPFLSFDVYGELASQLCTRPHWACEICRLPGHRRETCPDRPIN